MRRAIHRAGSEDFEQVLSCMTSMERPGRPPTPVDVDEEDEGRQGRSSGGRGDGSGRGIGNGMEVVDPKRTEAAADVTSAAAATMDLQS